MKKASRTILVTGVSGLLGAETAACLMRKGHAVVGFVHNEQKLTSTGGRPLSDVGRITVIRGDIALPRLGLGPEQWDGLRRRIETIVHCAAVTTIGLQDEVYEAVNFSGTRHVLDFAGGEIPFVHVSTAYVCGNRSGPVLEKELDVGQTFANGYERSKFRAEQLVAAARAGRSPIAVVRPSIVVGDSQSGAIRDLKDVYRLLRVWTRGELRTFPGRYDTMIDIVPIDYVADVIADVAERIEEVGDVPLHVVGAKPITLHDFNEVVSEYPSLFMPRFVPPGAFDVNRLPHEERRYFERVGRHHAPYLRRNPRFDCKTTKRFSERTAGEGGRPFLRTLLDYCVQAGFFPPASQRKIAALTG